MTPRERGIRLSEIAEELRGKPCVYGEDDCSMVVAQWVAEVTGQEFDYPLYNSVEEAEKIIDQAGGLVNIWSEIAHQIGLTEWNGEHTEIGDVGIIETSLGPVGGIFLHGGTFMWRAENGIRVLGVRPKRIIKVWKV